MTLTINPQTGQLTGVLPCGHILESLRTKPDGVVCVECEKPTRVREVHLAALRVYAENRLGFATRQLSNDCRAAIEYFLPELSAPQRAGDAPSEEECWREFLNGGGNHGGTRAVRALCLSRAAVQKVEWPEWFLVKLRSVQNGNSAWDVPMFCSLEKWRDLLRLIEAQK